MSARVRLVALCVALAAARVAAQQPAFRDTLLDRFVGEWTLQGTMRGQRTTQDVSVQWVLAHQYLRIREISREVQPDGSPTYEATVYIAWDDVAKEYSCVWLDVYGGIVPESVGHAKPGGKEITFLFTSRDGSSTHTTFAPGPTPDLWTWKLDNESSAGVLSPYARATLTRKPAPVPTR